MIWKQQHTGVDKRSSARDGCFTKHPPAGQCMTLVVQRYGGSTQLQAGRSALMYMYSPATHTWTARRSEILSYAPPSAAAQVQCLPPMVPCYTVGGCTVQPQWLVCSPQQCRPPQLAVQWPWLYIHNQPSLPPPRSHLPPAPCAQPQQTWTAGCPTDEWPQPAQQGHRQAQ